MAKAQRWTQVLIAGLMAVYLIYSLITGHVANYIAIKYLWLTWIAAGILLILSATTVVTLMRPEPDEHDHQEDEHDHSPHDHHHDHEATLRTWLGLGIVALPLLVGVLAPSQALDSRAVDQPISGDLSSINAAPASVRLNIAPQDRNILDWISAFGTAADPATLNGQQADVIGFVYRDARFHEADQFMVARFVMSCCAADAQAIGLVVNWPDAQTLKEDTWVRVRGTIQVGEFDGALAPLITADDGKEGVQTVDQPRTPYLYP
jgi:putative membrane protein